MLGQPIQITSAPVESLRAHTASENGPSVSPASFAEEELASKSCLL